MRKRPRNARELRQALAEDTSRQRQLALLESDRNPQLRRKSGKVVEIADKLAEEERTQARTDALVSARIIAMAGLPKRRTKAKMLSRTLRLGKDSWLEVSYHTDEDAELPFGEDRFVLAAIQHLAIQQGSPVVYFEKVNSLLKMFDFDTGGKGYARLRQRFDRLSNFSIRLVFAATEKELKERSSVQRTFVVQEVALPTRRQLKAAEAGQQMLLVDGHSYSYGVRLSAGFWDILQDQQHHLLAPVELLKLFIDCPTGWDYLNFLIARCGRARSSTVVGHDILMSLFKEGKEPDRNTIARLQKYHTLIMNATRGNLKASIEEMGYQPREEGQRGRPKKQWGLKINPSDPIVFSGKKIISADFKG